MAETGPPHALGKSELPEDVLRHLVRGFGARESIAFAHAVLEARGDEMPRHPADRRQIPGPEKEHTTISARGPSSVSLNMVATLQWAQSPNERLCTNHPMGNCRGIGYPVRF
jgi:hypothetical protein